MRHLILRIDVTYEHEDGSDVDEMDLDELTDILRDAAEHLANEGLLTGDDLPAVVGEWSATVERR